MEQEVLAVHLNKQTSLTWAALYVLPVLCVAYFSYLAAGFQLDDALIYLRYVRNFQEGSGLSFNESELFNGLTSPLYTALLVLGSFVVSDLQVLTIALSSIFFLGAALMSGHLLSRSPIEAAVCATLVASTGYFYSTFGMETGLFLFLIAASVLLYRQGSLWFLITLGLLFITRNEGVFLGLVLGGDYLYRHRRLPDWRFLFAAVVVCALPFIFNMVYYGAILPATGEAKIAQGKSGLWGGHWLFFNVAYFRDVFFAGSAFAPVFLGMSALAAVFFQRKNTTAFLGILFLVLLLFFYLGLNIPNYHWYYAPFVYFLIIFACRGVWQIGEIAFEQGMHSLRVPAYVLFLIAAIFTSSRVVSFDVRGASQYYVDMGRWLNHNTSDDTTVAMVEIGTVGWYSDREIVDILGLVSPHNAQYIGERKFMSWLLHYQPDYIIRHEPIWGHEQSISFLEKSGFYRSRDDVNISGLVLLEKSSLHTSDAIRKSVTNAIERRRALEKMQRNSEIDAPFLVLEGSSLFAHAPSALELELNHSIDLIRLGFGIREAAQGLHNRLCFSVSTQSDNENLFKHCIDAGAGLSAMKVAKIIRHPLPAGETLLFEIQCETSCDYAWTYWDEVAPEMEMSLDEQPIELSAF